MFKKLTVALAQIDIVWEDKNANKKICEQCVKQAADSGSDIVIFPEMTLTGFSMRVKYTGELESNSDTLDFFSSLAKKYKIAIIFGVVFFDSNSGLGKNMAIAVDSKGVIISSYQKIHPFSLASEDRFFSSGKKLAEFNLNGWKCSLAICYDLRFSELFESISNARPDIIFVIANWPQTRREHWEKLLCARALDTQSIVVGVNRVGKGNGLSYSGFSQAYEADGTLLLNAKSKKGLSIAEFDRRKTAEWRKKFPLFRDKKFHLYKHL